MPRFITVVEDDTIIGETVVEHLKADGFVPQLFTDGLEAEASLEEPPNPHLFILDIMLPRSVWVGASGENPQSPCSQANPCYYAHGFGG